MIPLIDLNRQVQSIKSEIKREVNRVIDEGFFVLDKNLEKFEKEFAIYCGTKFALGVANGTDALTISLKAASIGVGDEVLVPTNTFIATAEAVTHAGATPVFIDVNPKTYNIDLENVKVTPKTKAIIPVHLYGQPVNMDEVTELATKFDLKIIEDASQAHGAIYRKKKVGSFGIAGCFSFFPTKPLGAIGDGGIITTNDENIASRVKQLRNHGRAALNIHVEPGYTSRLDEIQAAVLSVKLKHLDQWNAMRKKIADQYTHLLDNLSTLQLPCCIPEAESVYYLYVIQTERRDELQVALQKQGMQALIHYPIPIHMQQAYGMYAKQKLVCAENLSKKILSLPMFAELTEDEILLIAEVTKRFVTTNN
jgi:dTDP-4-amino-4,6-dideoxygalactose transaminase